MLDCGCLGDVGWAVDADGVGRRGKRAVRGDLLGENHEEADEDGEKVGRGADPAVL